MGRDSLLPSALEVQWVLVALFHPKDRQNALS